MTKKEILQRRAERAAYVLANPAMLVSELAEHFGFTSEVMIQNLHRWRKAGLLPQDFKKYHCRGLSGGRVNRTGKPLPESERAPRMGWKIRPPKPKPTQNPKPKKEGQKRIAKAANPKAPTKPLLVGRAIHHPKKIGRMCSNGRAGVFLTTHNPEKVAIHSRDAEKVLVKVDSRTWKYVDKEKAASINQNTTKR